MAVSENPKSEEQRLGIIKSLTIRFRRTFFGPNDDEIESTLKELSQTGLMSLALNGGDLKLQVSAAEEFARRFETGQEDREAFKANLSPESLKIIKIGLSVYQGEVSPIEASKQISDIKNTRH